MTEAPSAKAIQAQSFFYCGKLQETLDTLQSIGGEKLDSRACQNYIIAETFVKDSINSLNVFSALFKIASTVQSFPTIAPLSWPVDSILHNIGPETSTLLFNIASLYFHEHEYEQCRTVLDSLFFHIESIDEYMAIKISFLFIESLLRLWFRNCCIHSDQFKSYFQLKMSKILQFLENVPCASFNNVNSSSLEIEGSVNHAKEREHLLKCWVQFKIHLYRCRISITLNQLKYSKKEIKSALEIFQREIRPCTVYNSSEIGSNTNDILLRIASTSASDSSCHITRLFRQNQLALYLKVCLINLLRFTIFFPFPHLNYYSSEIIS